VNVVGSRDDEPGEPTSTRLSGGALYALAEVSVVVALADRITVDPNQCGGRPCVRGVRIRVTDVLDLLAVSLSPAEVLGELPDLEPEDISACLRLASRRLDHPR